MTMKSEAVDAAEEYERDRMNAELEEQGDIPVEQPGDAAETLIPFFRIRLRFLPPTFAVIGGTYPHMCQVLRPVILNWKNSRTIMLKYYILD